MDLNGDNFSALCARAEAALNENAISFKGGNGDYTAGKTRLKIVPVGLPRNPFLVSLGVKSHSIDDFLLVLLHERSVYDQFLEVEKLKTPDFETTFSGLKKAAETLRKEGISIDRSKQMLDLVRAILGFRASPATLAERVLKAAPSPIAEDLLRPLAEAIP